MTAATRSTFSSVVVAATSFAVALGTARADADAVPVRVDYRPISGCPLEASFVEQIAARSHRIRPRREGESGPLLEVRVARAGHGARGDLVIRYADGNEARRDVEGDTCDSVMSALALMSVLALDPAALSSPSAAATAPDVTPPSAPATSTAEEAVKPPYDIPAERPRALDVQPGWHLGAGGTASGAGGSSPSLLLDFGGFFEVMKARDSIWSPVLRGGFEYGGSGTENVTGGGAVSAVRAVGTFDFCPVRLRPGPLRLMPCLNAQGGVIMASGHDIQPAHTDTRPWFALGVMGVVRYVPVSPFFVEIDGGLQVPLVRDHFYFEPGRVVYFPPVIGGLVGGAIGVTIL